MFRIIWCGIIKLLRFFIVIGAYVCAALIFIEVFFRYVLNTPIFGINELVLLIGIWLYFIASAYGAFEKSHIQVSIMHLILNDRMLAVSKSLASAITTFLSITMIQWSYAYLAWNVMKHGVTPALRIPLIFYQSAILFGAVFMSIYFFAEFIDNFLQIFGKRALFAQLSNRCR